VTTETIISRLTAAETGMVSDAMGRLRLEGWMDEVRALKTPQPMTAGRARPLLMAPRRGDGAWPHSMYATIDMLDPGDVLILATGGSFQNVLGDNMVNFARSRGLNGIVTDAPVRDVAAIRMLDMPVFARSPATRIPLNLEPVALDIPVICGGAQVRPGDYIVGDDDGVIVVPDARAEDVLFQLEDIQTVESALANAIRSGASVGEIEELIKRKKALRSA